MKNFTTSFLLALFFLGLMSPDLMAQRGRRSQDENTPSSSSSNGNSRSTRDDQNRNPSPSTNSTPIITQPVPRDLPTRSTGGNDNRNDNGGRRNDNESNKRPPQNTGSGSVDWGPWNNRDNNRNGNDNRNNGGENRNDRRPPQNGGDANRGSHDRNSDARRGGGTDWGPWENRDGGYRDRDRQPNPRSNGHRRPNRVYQPPRPDFYYHYDYRAMNWHRPIWNDRNRSSWRSTYTFKQYVFVDDGWDYNGSELEVRTKIRQTTNRSSYSQAYVEYEIDRIELYQDGYFLGSVTNIPRYLSRVTASVSPGGSIYFNNMTYLVGDPYAGFELINSRYTDAYYVGAMARDRSLRVGVLDLRARRVFEVRNSDFIGDGSYYNNAIVPLVPENDDWGFGYTVAGFDYRDDWYYDRDSRGGYGYEPNFRMEGGRQGTRRDLAPGTSSNFRNGNEQVFRTDKGQDVRLRRRVEVVKETN